MLGCRQQNQKHLQRALAAALDARLRDAAPRRVVRRQQRVRAGYRAQVRDHLPCQRLHLQATALARDIPQAS